MEIVSALFVENFNLREAPGPSTRIDLTGVFFSMAAPASSRALTTRSQTTATHCLRPVSASSW